MKQNVTTQNINSAVSVPKNGTGALELEQEELNRFMAVNFLTEVFSTVEIEASKGNETCQHILLQAKHKVGAVQMNDFSLSKNKGELFGWNRIIHEQVGDPDVIYKRETSY